MNIKNQYLESKLVVNKNEVTISFSPISNQYQIAVYVFQVNDKENVVIDKIFYKKQSFQKKYILQSGKYFLRFFIRNNNDNEFKKNINSRFFIINNLKHHMDDLINIEETVSTLNKLKEQTLNDIDFGYIRSIKHGSVKVSKDFYTIICNFSLSYLRKIDDIKNNSFFLNCIFYLGNISFLSKHKNELIFYIFQNKRELDERDMLFWYGILMYKLREYKISELAFSSLLGFKNRLSYHQTGAISFIDDISIFLTTPEKELKFTFMDNIECYADFMGCRLISCDLGYFSAYVLDALKELNDNLLTHIHIILPPNAKPSLIENYKKSYKNIYFSYEVLTYTNVNEKTYYSISRYLILRNILKRYQLPVVVVDADLDFKNIHFEKYINNIKDNEISLIMKDSDLPWLKVMAGFNIFGSKTGESLFLSMLYNYLYHCFVSGRDGWMLDQVSLGRCVEYFTENKFEDDDCFITSIKGSSVKQVSNRSAKRREAQKVVANLK